MILWPEPDQLTRAEDTALHVFAWLLAIVALVVAGWTL